MRRVLFVISSLLIGAAGAAAQALPALPLPRPEIAFPLGPRTLPPALVACTDLPTSSEPVSPFRVVAAHAGTNHLSYAPGDVVVLNGGTPQGYAAGQRYFIRRLQPGLDGARPTPATPGAIRTAGWLTVVAADENAALARIDYACDAVVAGDYLDPYVEPVLPTDPGPAAQTDFSVLSRVLFGADRRQQFGAGDVMNIDRGSAQGLAAGMHVGIYRDRRNGTPLVELGAGIVVEVAAETAKVVLTRAREEVRRGDYVAMRSVVP